MIVEIYYYDKFRNENNNIVREDIGTIEVNNFNANEIFDIIGDNYFITDKNKIDKRITIKDNATLPCSSGLCFRNPDDNSYWFAKSIGWMHGSLEEIEDYIKQRQFTMYL